MLCACSRWESGLLRFPRRGSLFPRVLCVTGIDRHQESSQAWRLRSGRAVGVLGLPCILPPVLKLSPATAIFHVTRNSDSDRELQTEEMAFPPFIIRLEKERSTVNGTSSTRRPTVSACRLPRGKDSKLSVASAAGGAGSSLGLGTSRNVSSCHACTERNRLRPWLIRYKPPQMARSDILKHYRANPE